MIEVLQDEIIVKKGKKKGKVKSGISKQTINIIRTTQKNTYL